ncbi:MAG: hypothetical protein JW755_06195 [Candidatus Aminicenantes bacterium]|nr:hypothetical protein [Candidatus Aminicenantes bacterium]
MLGSLGVLLGLIFTLVFIYHRIRFITKKLSKKLATRKAASVPGPFASLRNLLLIFLWIAIFGMVFFMGFFFQAYHAFTLEVPVAKVTIIPQAYSKSTRIELVQYKEKEAEELKQEFELTGEQWMLEGDILKWKDWVNFMGWHTRYRLTRLRSRYIRTEDEKTRPSSIYQLAAKEDHPFWGYLYKHGHKLPFVSTVYGNAVFQSTKEEAEYLVFVTTSGFIARKQEKEN